MIRWEYKVLKVPGISVWGRPTKTDELQESLVKLGNDGWELVSVVLVHATLMATLKRPK